MAVADDPALVELPRLLLRFCVFDAFVGINLHEFAEVKVLALYQPDEIFPETSGTSRNIGKKDGDDLRREIIYYIYILVSIGDVVLQKREIFPGKAAALSHTKHLPRDFISFVGVGANEPI